STQRPGLFSWLFGPGRSAAAVAADDWQHLAGDVARAGRRREKNKGGGNLFRLRRPSHRGVGAECLDRFGRLVRRIERRPYKTRRDHVDPNAAVNEMGCEGARKGVNAALRHLLLPSRPVTEPVMTMELLAEQGSRQTHCRPGPKSG